MEILGHARYKRVLFTAVACILVLLTSCAPAAQNPTANKPVPNEPQPAIEPSPAEEDLTGFFPFKTGNMWEYEGEGMEYASLSLTPIGKARLITMKIS